MNANYLVIAEQTSTGTYDFSFGYSEKDCKLIAKDFIETGEEIVFAGEINIIRDMTLDLNKGEK